MSTKRILTAIGSLAAAMTWLACSGGTEGPDVFGPGPGPGESPQPNPPSGEPTEPPPQPTGTVPTGTPTGTGTGTGVVTCTTCANVILDGAAPENMCSGSDAAWSALETCLCDDYCTTECTDYCYGGDISTDCSLCVTNYCGSLLNACQNN